MFTQQKHTHSLAILFEEPGESAHVRFEIRFEFKS